jgi:hypothetical protein
MQDKTEKLLSILKLQPVVPVLVVEDAATAVPLARALVAGGEPLPRSMPSPPWRARWKAPSLVPARCSMPRSSVSPSMPAPASSSRPARRRNFSTPQAGRPCRSFPVRRRRAR